jgi:hypothetical protein
MKRSLGTATLTVLMLVSALAGQEGYKDLSQEAPNPLRYLKFHSAPSCANRGGGSASGSAGDPAPWYPLKLSMIDMDVNVLRLGSEFTAMLQLQNVGKDLVRLPWLLDAQALEQPDQNGNYEYSEVALSLTVSQGKYSTHFQVPVRLYGSNSNPESWIDLHPGSRLQVRVKIPLNCASALFGCKSLIAGPAQAIFAWTESKVNVAYQECSIASGSERGRYVSSEVLVRDIDVSNVRP